MKILVINGPNMNMLGKRDGKLYGTDTLESVNARIAEYATEIGADTDFFQSNGEGEIIDRIQQADCDGIVLNPAAFTHYSYAIRDAVECCGKPVVEVHMTDITSREPFRAIRVTDGVVEACYYGNGVVSYLDAVKHLVEKYGQK